ncbi:MAG: FecR domain-containing protein [Ignavibacteriaceae bacterium]|nr:FecR domain-containing protein [Ignavibacteriaceae bacterium]
MEKPDNNLIIRFMENRCSVQEYEQMKSYLHTLSEEELNTFMDIHIKKSEEGRLEINAEYSPNFRDLLLRLGKKKERHFSIIPRSGYSIAASIVFLLVLASVALYYTGMFNNKHERKNWKEMQTVVSQKSIITFLDGTKITLNADSKLKYPESFEGSKREVYLEGEAYFEVAHDTSRPFIVHCKNIATTVLGTKFDVSAYENDKKIAVSLVEGKVNVSDDKQNSITKLVTLRPKQQFLYNTVQKTYNLKEFNIDEITGWKDNLLKFNNETLGNVFVRLERAYGVKFELAPGTSNNSLITTNFKNTSLMTVTEAIRKFTGLDYDTIKENYQIKKIIFKKK